MSDEYHALLSPSSAHRWLNCANAPAMEIGQPEGDTKAADLGTDKHELLTLCLQFDKNAMDYAGHILKKGHTVNPELAVDVQTVIDNVRERIESYRLRGATVTIELEQDLPIGHVTGEQGATGRGDVCLIIEWQDGIVEGDVIDAKFGYQEVDPDSPQLKLYAAGMIEKFGLIHDFGVFNLVIEQPARGYVEPFMISAKEIEEWCDVEGKREDFGGVSYKADKAMAIYRLASEGQLALREEDFAPSEKTCRWCKAKAVCPALLAKVEETIGDSFEEIDETAQMISAQTITVERLGEIFPNLELIEDWVKAVRARIEAEMFAGRQVPGVKVVAGKRGNRAWSSEEEAEALMKKFKMKVDQMYAFKLLGPKPILEALKDQPRRLKQIEALVVQPDGKPHVVHESDKRPAIEIKPVEEGFDELC